MQQPQRASAQQPEAQRLAFGLAANDPSATRSWVVAMTRQDHSVRSEAIQAATSNDAFDAGDALVPDALRITVRPLIELTYGEGARRFPDPLHLQASAEADLGWRASEENQRRNRLALELQIQQSPRQWGIA